MVLQYTCALQAAALQGRENGEVGRASAKGIACLGGPTHVWGSRSWSARVRLRP